MSNQPNLWGFNPNQIGGKVGVDYPETSQRASMRVKSGSQKAQALLALSDKYPNDGLTAFEISDLILNGAAIAISPNQAATRLGELREQGLAIYLFDQFGKPEERETTPGNTGYVHTLSRFGYGIALDLRREQVTNDDS